MMINRTVPFFPFPSSEAIAATNAYIQSSINNGNFGGAIHAAQDLATPEHAGQKWKGFDWSKWSTYSHLLGDISPRMRTKINAYKATKDILNRISNNKKECK